MHRQAQNAPRCRKRSARRQIAGLVRKQDVHADGSDLQWSGSDSNDNILFLETPLIDVLIGGPPCQGFSPLGRMNDWDKQDPRNKLWQHYVRLLSKGRLRVCIIENVPELLTSLEFRMLLRSIKELGYVVEFGVLNAAVYGVQHNRIRAIIIGCRLGDPKLPEPLTRRRTVRDAIADLSRQRMRKLSYRT